MESLIRGDASVLHGLALDVLIGIHDWERKQPQTVLIDLEMRIDGTRASRSDCIEDTVNYEKVALRLREAVAMTNFQLLESLGRFVLQLLADEFGIAKAVILLRKPNVVPHTDLAGVRLVLE